MLFVIKFNGESYVLDRPIVETHGMIILNYEL